MSSIPIFSLVLACRIAHHLQAENARFVRRLARVTCRDEARSGAACGGP